MAGPRLKTSNGPEPRRPAPTADLARRRALRALVGRIRHERQAIARRTVDRYRQEIVDYRLADDEVLEDAYAFALANVDMLLQGLEHGGMLSEEQLERTRLTAARRLHQRVSLESLLQAGRVSARVAWEGVLAAARADHLEEREAALEIAGVVLRQMDIVSTIAAQAYLDELNDRGLIAQDLLDALIAGQGDREVTRRRARVSHIRLAESYVVIVLRPSNPRREWGHAPSLAARVALDRVVAAMRSHLRPSAGALLGGMRRGDLVAFYPVSGPGELERVRGDCQELAVALPTDVRVGMSGWHPGLSAVSTAYDEALDAADIAVATGVTGRAVVLEEVLVDHLLRGSAHADRILAATLRPLIEYDRERGTDLLPTLRAYIGANLNLTASARAVSVHPNTIVYRLRRIKELSGRDPHDPDDLLALTLALKALDLRARP